MLFEVLDADNSQALDVDEIRHFFRTLGLELDAAEVFDVRRPRGSAPSQLSLRGPGCCCGPARRPLTAALQIVLDLDVDRSGELEFTEFATVCHILRQEYLEEAERLAWQRTRSWRKAVWRLFEDPSSSRPARFIGVAITSLIGAPSRGGLWPLTPTRCLPEPRPRTHGPHPPLPGLSVIFFCAETVPELDWIPPALWRWSEVAFTTAFTVEYLLRLWSSPAKGPFFGSAMNAVDLFAIAPFYIELFANLAAGNGTGAPRQRRPSMQCRPITICPCHPPNIAPLSRGLGTGSFRVVRLIRIFRVFKLSRYSKHLKLFAATWARSTPVRERPGLS